mmetsp:Transcript_14606/g.35259  ORF Transcript_14606/g.35259 Transcript_14606/m.35259 type:complete len:123 (-) Transcript_14606:856-1224(-)
MKMKMPTKCSKVHLLSKRRKERNSVVALRAVDVMDIASAPKFFVIAAEHELPKKPMLEKRIMIIIFEVGEYDLSSRGTLSCCSAYVPGCIMKMIPSLISPFIVAADVIATKAIEYILNMNSS